MSAIRKLLVVGAGLALVIVFGVVAWCVSIAWVPYGATADAVERAPPLEAYSPLLVSTFRLVEAPDEAAAASQLSRLTVPGRGTQWLVAQVLVRESIALSKPEHKVLSAYLASAYLGLDGARPIRGVEDAARTYFGKGGAALTPAEVALLVGLFRAPGRDSPLKSIERARARREIVLERMRDSSLISEREFSESVDAPLSPAQPGVPADVHASGQSVNRMGRCGRGRG